MPKPQFGMAVVSRRHTQLGDLVAVAENDLAGAGSSVLALIDDNHAVDDHVGNTLGIAFGVLEGVGLVDLRGIEDGDVRGEALM